MNNPRDEEGKFRPPQYLLNSVRPNQLKRWDRVSWNHNGAAIIAIVADAWDGTDDTTGLSLLDEGGRVVFCDQLPSDMTINTVEA